MIFLKYEFCEEGHAGETEAGRGAVSRNGRAAAQPDFYNDPKAASQLLKEQRQLEPIITAYRSYRRTQAEQEDLRAMLSEGLEPEMKALCQEEFSENKKSWRRWSRK